MEEDSFFSSYNGNQCSPKLFGYQKSSKYIFFVFHRRSYRFRKKQGWVHI